jgi:hypothetical protein
MKFLLKQLQLFFPFVFPMYDTMIEDGTASIKISVREYAEYQSLKKQVEELIVHNKKLEAQVKELEEKRKDPEKYFWTH